MIGSNQRHAERNTCLRHQGKAQPELMSGGGACPLAAEPAANKTPRYAKRYIAKPHHADIDDTGDLQRGTRQHKKNTMKGHSICSISWKERL